LTLPIPLVKSRPQSFEGSAMAVPSPSTLASFSNQQDSARSEPAHTGISTVSGSSTPSHGGDGTSTKPSDTTFDFQIFLDQMKTRSADPVSRYLRS
jgi:hypothetical protein